MPASQPAHFNLQEFTDTGQLLVGGRLYTYAYGTTAQKIAFTDPDGTVPHTYTPDGAGGQYVALNARGELPAPLYLADGSYDISLKRADGSTVWTRKADGVDNFLRSFMASLATALGASLVGFITTGAGAVARTAQGKLRDIVSVKDFGAIGDGIADDTDAFQKAIAASRTVYVPTGDFRIKGIGIGWNAQDDVALYGDGPTSRITRTDAGDVIKISNCNRVMVRDLKVTGLKTYVVSAAINLTNCTEIFVNGNRVASSSRQGIQAEACTNGTISNNIVTDCYQDGIMVRSGSARITVTGNTCYNNGDPAFGSPIGEGIHVFDATGITISGNTSYSNKDHGITLEGADYCIVTGNISRGNVVCGVSINAGTNAGVGNVISGNTFVGNGSDGAVVSNVSDNKIAGNNISNNGGYGVRVGVGLGFTQNRIDVRGNTISGNALGALIQDWNNNDCAICDNTLRGPNGRGILINRAQSVDTTITGNNVKGFVTAQITDNGTTSRIRKNDIGNRLCGRAVLVAGTANVAFAVTEVSSAYVVVFNSTVAETFYVANKSAAGFDIKSSNAASTATVDWSIVESKTS